MNAGAADACRHGLKFEEVEPSCQREQTDQRFAVRSRQHPETLNAVVENGQRVTDWLVFIMPRYSSGDQRVSSHFTECGARIAAQSNGLDSGQARGESVPLGGCAMVTDRCVGRASAGSGGLGGRELFALCIRCVALSLKESLKLRPGIVTRFTQRHDAVRFCGAE